MISQRYLDHVAYNQEVAPDLWSVDVADRRIKK
jgi:hypothetical protein